MKYAFTLSLCWLSLLLTGQEDRMDYFFHELGANIFQSHLVTNEERLFSSSSTTWVAGTVIDACRDPSAFYWHKDISPIQSWVVGIKDADFSRVVEAAWHDDTLIVLGIQPCYDGGPAPITKIGKFDTSGNLLMSASYFGCEGNIGISVEPRGLENTCPVLAVDEDGAILFATSIGLMRVEGSEDLFPQIVDVNLGPLIGLIDLPGAYVGIATPNEVAMVDLTTDSILLTTSHTATAMTEADSSLWYINGSNLHRIGTDLSTGAWLLPDENADQVCLTNYQEQPLVYVPGGGVFRAWLFNPETETFEQLINWELDGVEVFAIEPFREDTFFVSGQLTYDRRGFVKKATLSSFSFQQPYDVGIRSLDLELLGIELNESLGEYNYRLTFQQTMEIENYGTGVIREINLEWDTRHDWCAIPGYQVLTDLALQPGDVYTITDTMLHVFSVSGPISGSVTYEFNTFAPNHYLDANPENDTISGGFLVTSVDEQLIPAEAVQLFPIPASGTIQVQSDAPIDQLELYDTFGRLLRSRQLEGVNHTALKREGLPAGVYLLRLHSSNHYGVRQFIWTDRY